MGNMTNTFFDNLDAAATWSAGVAFKRSKGLPLDKYSVFETKTLAIEYAEKRGAYAETPVSYPGQVIAVAEGNKMVAYVLAENAEGTKLELQQIGIIPTGDDKTIDVTEDGVISLLAADKEVFKKDAEGNPTEEKEINAGAQLVLQADGTLKWVKPDTTTVEGLSTAVTDLQGRMTTAETDIDALEAKVGAAAEGETAATGLFKAIADLDDAIKAEEKDRKEADTKLSERIGAASVPETTEGAGDGKAATGVYVAIEAEVARAKAAEKVLDEAIKAIDFVDNDELTTALAPYAKTDDVNKTLEDYAKTADVNKTLEDYAKTDDVNKTLEDYATIDYVDGKIETVEEAISKLNHFTTKIVNSTDEVTEEGVLYLIKDTSVTGADKYNEYLFVGGEAVLIGDTTTDLSDYYTQEQVNSALSGKADKVTSATAGNFAGLDANGNLIDSGKKAADFAPADIDTGVHSVSLASGTNNGTVKLTVDGVDTDNIAVKGLGTAAYKADTDFVSAADGLELNNAINGASAAASSAVEKIGVTDWIDSAYNGSNITKELIRIDSEIDGIGLDINAIDGKFTNYYTKGETDSAILVETNRAKAAEEANAAAIALKADQTALENAVSTINGAIALKADQTALDETNRIVATKANQSALETAVSTLEGKITTAQNQANKGVSDAATAQAAAEAAQAKADSNAVNIEQHNKELYGEGEGEQKVEGLVAKVSNNTSRIATAEGTIAEHTTAIGNNATAAAQAKAQADEALRIANLKTTMGEVEAKGYAVAETVNAEIAKKTTMAEVEAKGYAVAETVNGELAKKADKETTYTKDDIDGKVNTINGEIAKKADADKVYTKDEIDATVSGINTEIGKKADKTYVDAELDKKATNEALAEALAEAKKYADDNDADTKYGIVYDKENKKIKLTNNVSDTEIDATDFIKDGMIEKVELSDDGLNLVITWNTDSGKTDVTTIPLTGLVDVYTGVDGAQIKVSVSADNKISAELKTSVTDEIAKGVAAKTAIDTYGDIVTHNVAEFATSAQGGKADTAVQPGDLGTMAKETASDYVKKTDAPGYTDILTKTEASTTYQPAGNYAPADIDTGVMSVTSLHDAIVVTPGANGAITINFADEIILNGGGANVAAAE